MAHLLFPQFKVKQIRAMNFFNTISHHLTYYSKNCLHKGARYLFNLQVLVSRLSRFVILNISITTHLLTQINDHGCIPSLHCGNTPRFCLTFFGLEVILSVENFMITRLPVSCIADPNGSIYAAPNQFCSFPAEGHE